MRDARAVTHVGIGNPRWRAKRSRHSRHMRNPQFYVSGKRPIREALYREEGIWRPFLHHLSVAVPETEVLVASNVSDQALEAPVIAGRRSHHGRSWKTCWRHLMGIFSVLLALCSGNSQVNGEFPSERPVTQSFDVFFDLRLNKWLNKQLRHWWFETLSRSLWRHCKIYMICVGGCWLKKHNVSKS